MPAYALYLLGSPRIERDGIPVDVDTRKAIALLAYLAISGTPHQRDSLAGLLWPDYDQTSARAALRRTLSALNKALDNKGLQVSRESLLFDPNSGIFIDLIEFRSLVEQVRQHHPANQPVCDDCLALLVKAEKVAAGRFMEGFNLRDSPPFDEWQFFQNEALNREVAGVLGSARSRVRNLAPDYDLAISYAKKWLSLDPLLEEPHRLLMLLYASAGQRNAALRQYRECIRVLDQELGVTPLEETTRVYQNILENRHQAERESARQNPVQSTTPLANAVITRACVPGINWPSGAEWESLVSAWRRASKNGQVIILTGEAGIGKTRLAEEFIASLREQNLPVIHAHCYDGQENLAYAPLLDAYNNAIQQEHVRSRLADSAGAFLAEARNYFPRCPVSSRFMPPQNYECRPGRANPPLRSRQPAVYHHARRPSCRGALLR